MQRLIYNPKYSLYNLGEDHPFSPLRNEMLLDLLNTIFGEIDYEEPKLISPEIIKNIHDREYVDVVEKLSAGEEIENIERFGLGTADNPVTENMAEGARWQCAGSLLGAKILIENKANTVLQLGGGFHHAHYNYAAGFCLYNDLVLAINEMIANGMHVLYLDIDVHHGDGVQELLYSNGNVLTLSIHESGEYLFPGTGWLHRLGQGSGRALKLNFPLEPFTEGESYLYVLEAALKDALIYFRPDAMVIQAGADAHFFDPLADLLLTTNDYEKIFNLILELADKYAKGRTLFTLGGGYSFGAAIRIWALLYAKIFNLKLPEEIPVEWRDKWEKLTGKKLPKYFHDPPGGYDPIPRKEEIEKANKQLVRKFRDAVAPYWF